MEAGTLWSGTRGHSARDDDLHGMHDMEDTMEQLRQQRAADMARLADEVASRLGDSVMLAFDGEARRSWTYLPGSRRGVALSEMDRASAKAAMNLLAAGLSVEAYAKAVAVMALEDLLDAMEHGSRDRHRGDYWLAVFGDPDGRPWGWRLGGHHLSVNWTVGDDGTPSATPLFLGANPARTRSGAFTVLAPLAAQEDGALALVEALDGDQRAAAILPTDVPADILTGDAAKLDDLPPAEGIRLTDLGGQAARAAHELVDVYARQLPDAMSLDADDARFVWIGGTGPDEPCYYRIQGPRLLIEFDNTQNGANHIHSVMRDPTGDFGDDVLRSHRRAAH
jgi:hypothetical protein